jgi:hypothetical protein
MEVEFLGIPFRNQNHLNWFIATQTFFWSMIFVTGLLEYFSKEPWWMQIPFLLCGILFGGISWSVYRLTDGGTRVLNEYTSPDCVWYNLYLSLTYFALTIGAETLKRIRYRKTT